MITVKLVLLEQTNIGKTTIINQFIEGSFNKNILQTMGLNKSNKRIKIYEKEINLEILDTIGCNLFANKLFLKNKKIGLLVYDMTKEESFNTISKWYELIDNVVGKNNIVFDTVGNKND